MEHTYTQTIYTTENIYRHLPNGIIMMVMYKHIMVEICLNQNACLLFGVGSDTGICILQEQTN